MSPLLSPVPAESDSAGLSWPSRLGADLDKGRRLARPLKWLLPGVNPEPTAADWQQMGWALTVGDPLADDLARWMRQAGMHDARVLFEQALEHGLHALPQAPEPLRRFFAAVEHLPAWVDDARLDEGARLCHLSGRIGMRVLRDAALMAGYQASAINRTLVLTGALAKGAQRRVAETTKWWLDVTTPGALRPGGVGYKSTLRVRLMHALVRQRVQALPEWDAAELGVPVNQSDMLATYLGFSVIFLFGQRVMGVRLSRQEGETVMHLWRAIGWLMGVDESLLVHSETEGRIRLYQQLVGQAPADATSRELGRALMNEPLTRHYRRLPALAGRIERAKHLSLCSLFIGREGRRDLGLPEYAWPWYPLLLAPTLFLWHRAWRLLPGGRVRLMKWGRRRQAGYLGVLFGAEAPDLARLAAQPSAPGRP